MTAREILQEIYNIIWIWNNRLLSIEYDPKDPSTYYSDEELIEQIEDIVIKWRAEKYWKGENASDRSS